MSVLDGTWRGYAGPSIEENWDADWIDLAYQGSRNGTIRDPHEGEMYAALPADDPILVKDLNRRVMTAHRLADEYDLRRVCWPCTEGKDDFVFRPDSYQHTRCEICNWSPMYEKTRRR